MRKSTWIAAFLFASALSTTASAACTATGFIRDGINMTAAAINPPLVTGTLDASGCNIAVYYSAGNTGLVQNATIYGANYFGVLVNGDAGAADVDIIDSDISQIGENPLNGTQHGVGIYYRGFFPVSAVTGRITGNRISKYQKGGIVANGPGVQVRISGNTVLGGGHINYIAQNGIQIGYAAQAQVMGNRVSGNSYIGVPGDGSASGGVLVVGGPGYGLCPDGNACPYTVNTIVNDNTLTNNDVGIYLTNLAADFSAPTSQTNVKAVNNAISNDLCFNTSYQAAISDVGNNDKMINNTISGGGYAATCPSGFGIDADKSFTNRPKVNANRFN